jgi:hypothetical protein
MDLLCTLLVNVQTRLPSDVFFVILENFSYEEVANMRIVS